MVTRAWQNRDYPRSVVEVVPRKEFVQEFGADYQPGQHVSGFGPTGRGKSRLFVQCLCQVISPDHPVFSLHGKIRGRDPVMTASSKKMNVRLVEALPSVTRQRVDTKRKYNGYLIAPLVKPSSPEEENTKMQKAFRDAIQQNYRTTGRNTITHINEAHQTQVDLKLKSDVESPLMRGGPDNAVWHEAQRGKWLTYHTYSAPEHIFVFYDDDSDNRKRYADFGCADPEEIFWITSHLKTKRVADGRTISQCLYIRRSGGMYVVDT